MIDGGKLHYFISFQIERKHNNTLNTENRSKTVIYLPKEEI